MSAAFDRTYEGLKPNPADWLLEAARAFDRTYEGLKLVLVLGLQHGPYVLLTVPMRV